jgi:putative addiction module component (TIGR02574 family)
MSETAEKLKDALLKLSEAERWEMLGTLVESLPSSGCAMSEGTPEFDAELDRRRKEHETGADPGTPAGEFFRTLREKTP